MAATIETKSSSYYLGTRREVSELLPGSYSRVLEIGCGEGGFRSHLGECEYWGIEPQRGPAALARQRLFKVIDATYEDAYGQLPDCYFDLVICNDVIEHMTAPEQFLESIKNKVRPGARLVGSIPNVRFVGNLFEVLCLKDWQYTDQGILDRTHLRFFTEKSIRRMFETHGFLIEQLSGINAVPVTVWPVRLLVKNLFVLMLGADSRFFQFGFRVKWAPSLKT